MVCLGEFGKVQSGGDVVRDGNVFGLNATFWVVGGWNCVGSLEPNDAAIFVDSSPMKPSPNDSCLILIRTGFVGHRRLIATFLPSTLYSATLTSSNLSTPMKLAGLKTLDSAHEDCIWSVAWAPATENRPPVLLTGSLDETVKLWKPDELELLRTNTGHCLGVVSVAAHPSGSIAASASLDSFVRVFDVDSNATIATLEAPPSEVWQMQFNPKGTVLAVAGGGSASVKLWDTATWQLIDTLAVPRPEGPKPSDKNASKKFVLSVAWSPDGRRLACGSMDGTISVFDVPRAKFLHQLEGHFMPVRSLVFSPMDPRLLFSASDDTNVHMYDAEGKTLASALSGHASWVLSVDVSSDGVAVATGSSDKTVRLWDLTMRAAIQTMTNHKDQVWGVAFRPAPGGSIRGGNRLASVSDDKSISLYDYS